MDYIDINKHSPIPLYKQLENSIKIAIDEGILLENDKLPTEKELSDHFKISRTVIRQAYSHLLAEEYIDRYIGKGTFVREKDINTSFFKEIISFEDEMKREGLEFKTKVLDFKVINCNQDICNKLKLNIDDNKCIYLERLRFSEGHPIALIKAYLPYAKFKKLMSKNFEKNSLYKVLYEIYNIEIRQVNRSFQARIASNRDAKILGMTTKEAVQYVESVDYDQYGEIVQYSQSKYVGSRNNFDVIIRKG